MANYKFPQFNIQISNPQINVLAVYDNINEKKCMVDVELITYNVSFGLTLDGFEYTDTWDDDNILNWVLSTKLPEYKV